MATDRGGSCRCAAAAIQPRAADRDAAAASHSRRQQAALASRRFAALCNSHELLRELHFPAIWELRALHSLTAWLARHGRHAQQLSFTADRDEENEGVVIVDESGMAEAVASCLAAAGTAGQLSELSVRLYGQPLHTEWLSAMRSLRRLTLGGDNTLHISPAISGLTALQSLQINADALRFGAGSRLPAAITRLQLELGYEHLHDMPEQARCWFGAHWRACPKNPSCALPP